MNCHPWLFLQEISPKSKGKINLWFINLRTDTLCEINCNLNLIRLGNLDLHVCDRSVKENLSQLLLQEL